MFIGSHSSCFPPCLVAYPFSPSLVKPIANKPMAKNKQCPTILPINTAQQYCPTILVVVVQHLGGLAITDGGATIKHASASADVLTLRASCFSPMLFFFVRYRETDDGTISIFFLWSLVLFSKVQRLAPWHKVSCTSKPIARPRWVRCNLQFRSHYTTAPVPPL